jgi:EAL domain-containing protein (putative c-di-GMP-specific phosphodiesterase class I)
LHHSVTAEGVETQEQLAFLNNQNCDMLQGYLFSRPATAEQLESNFKLAAIKTLYN